MDGEVFSIFLISETSRDIKKFMATYILKLKWAWQALRLSHTLLILKIYTTYKDVQMMLKHFFDISTGFRYKKNGKEFSVHL